MGGGNGVIVRVVADQLVALLREPGLRHGGSKSRDDQQQDEQDQRTQCPRAVNPTKQGMRHDGPPFRLRAVASQNQATP